MDRTEFLDIIKEGVRVSIHYTAQLTDFHGGPLETEYLLTTDIARAFLAHGYPASVEPLYRQLIVAGKQRHDKPVPRFGARRADVAVVDLNRGLQALVEVKISPVGRTLGKIKTDLDKMAQLVRAMGPGSAAKANIAAVFQVHVKGRGVEDIGITRLASKLQGIKMGLKKDLEAFAKGRPDFDYKLVSLTSLTDSVTPTQVYDAPGELPELGPDGHATAYFAITMGSLRKVPKAVTFKDRLRSN